jgi:hypothetical protein
MTSRPLPSFQIVALGAAFAVSLPRGALAQSAADKAGAEELLSEGLKRVEVQDYPGACSRFEESLKLYASINTEYHLADCYEHVGKLASAWVDFLEVAEKAQAARETAKATKARERSHLIEMKVSRLTLVIAEPTMPGLKITRDDVDVGRAQWGVSMPSDSGEHVVTASAPGRLPVTLRVTVGENGSAVTLAVPKLGEASAAPSPPVAAPSALPPTLPPEAPPASPAAASKGGHLAAWVVGGAGVAAIGTGVAMVLAAKASYDGASGCTGSVCTTQSGFDTRNSARSAGNVAAAVLWVGAAAVVGGGILWITAPGASSADSTFRVGVTLGGLVAQGAL